MVTNYLDGNLTFESEVGVWATERPFSVDGRSDVNEKLRCFWPLREYPEVPCKWCHRQHKAFGGSKGECTYCRLPLMRLFICWDRDP
jgi:hypothetical protein